MNIERFNPVDDRFEECGGEILKLSDNGNPTEWIYGLTLDGIPVHPPEANIDPKDKLLVRVEKHPNKNGTCLVASIEEPPDQTMWT